MKTPLKTRLVRYLKNNPTWHASIALQRLVMEKGAGTGKTTTRRLQEAVNDGLLEVRYEKGAAQYRIRTETLLKTQNTAPQTPSKYLQGAELEQMLGKMSRYFLAIPNLEY